MSPENRFSQIGRADRHAKASFQGQWELRDHKPSLTSIGQPVPELPVVDVERAQQHYRDAIGCDIGWSDSDEIRAVPRGSVAMFFRNTAPPFQAAVHWVFAKDLDATYDELKSSGANIVGAFGNEAVGAKAFHRRTRVCAEEPPERLRKTVGV